VTVSTDASAVRVVSELPLTVLSSAIVGGGIVDVRHIVNMRVGDVAPDERPEEALAAFAARCGIAEPYVGLMTAAETQHARVAAAAHDGVAAAAAVSVGLSNTTAAGLSAPAPAPAGTINTILIVDAALTAAALVNAVITATEAKTTVLRDWDVLTPEGHPASGTSTDAVVVAATGRGEPLAYAGPATVTGWLVGRVVRLALGEVLSSKVERDGGRDGW
jgi:iron complex transport system ATP-binding protein